TSKSGDYRLSLIEKVVCQQYSDNADTRFYKLRAYDNMDFKGSVTLTDNLELSAGIYNVLNERNLLAAGITDKTPIGGVNVYDIANRNNSLDTYAFQPARNYQITLKAQF